MPGGRDVQWEMGELGRAGGQAGMGRKMGREGKGGLEEEEGCKEGSAAARHCPTGVGGVKCTNLVIKTYTVSVEKQCF